jgi:hypothetical protein
MHFVAKNSESFYWHVGAEELATAAFGCAQEAQAETGMP